MRTPCKGCLVLVCWIAVRAVLASEGPPFKTKARKAHSIGRSIAQCLGSGHTLDCLQQEAINAIELAIADNSTWHCGRFMEFEKQTPPPPSQSLRLEARSLGDRIGEKLLDLARSRSVRLRLPDVDDVIKSASGGGNERRGISDALDDLTAHLTGNSGLLVNVDTADADEGRKKKDKDKGVAMMGGMAMMAMVAQMFLGKVILIAGSAFIMAKIALLVSVLGSLKKGSSSSSGNTEHIIVSGGGGGGGGGHDSSSSSGWHRSMPYDVEKEPQYFPTPIAADSGWPTTEASSYYSATEAPAGFL